mmetsp:Transcript_48492/g.128477  ORF Transcript_48492/g.128477 Transcript_48492/m.128477 type:complete len:247 (-) Transcript_48492:645-1385(-)
MMTKSNGLKSGAFASSARRSKEVAANPTTWRIFEPAVHFDRMSSPNLARKASSSRDTTCPSLGRFSAMDNEVIPQKDPISNILVILDADMMHFITSQRSLDPDQFASTRVNVLPAAKRAAQSSFITLFLNSMTGLLGTGGTQRAAPTTFIRSLGKEANGLAAWLRLGLKPGLKVGLPNLCSLHGPPPALRLGVDNCDSASVSRFPSLLWETSRLATLYTVCSLDASSVLRNSSICSCPEGTHNTSL